MSAKKVSVERFIARDAKVKTVANGRIFDMISRVKSTRFRDNEVLSMILRTGSLGLCFKFTHIDEFESGLNSIKSVSMNLCKMAIQKNFFVCRVKVERISSPPVLVPSVDLQNTRGRSESKAIPVLSRNIFYCP